MTDYRQRLAEVKAERQFLMKESKAVGKAMYELHNAAINDGALGKKEKELIGLGIAIAKQCEGCILSHIESAMSAGASLDEIVEAVEVSILMGGGPSVTYGGMAIEAAKQFLA